MFSSCKSLGRGAWGLQWRGAADGTSQPCDTASPCPDSQGPEHSWHQQEPGASQGSACKSRDGFLRTGASWEICRPSERTEAGMQRLGWTPESGPMSCSSVLVLSPCSACAGRSRLGGGRVFLHFRCWRNVSFDDISLYLSLPHLSTSANYRVCYHPLH